jgi:hypothetical protein
MDRINTYKAGLAALGLICVTLLMIFGAVTSGAGMPIITLIVGYAVGNGIASKQGQPVEPIIKPKRREADQPEGD